MPSVEEVLDEANKGRRTNPADWIDTAIKEAVDVGVPKDQLTNFLRAGIALQPKQWQMAAAARQCDEPGGPVSLGAGGGRGGGKSHWLIAQMAADDCQRFPGLKCLLLRKEGKANREHLNDLRRAMLKGVAHRYKEQAGILELPKDSRIVVGHFQNENDIDNYLGVEYDVIGIEEATTLSLTKYNNIRSCLRTSKKGWRPRDYSTANPGGIGHVWYRSRFIQPWRTGFYAPPMSHNESKFVQSLVGDNKFNNTEYVKILDQMGGWQRRAWLEGDWDIMAGQFFTTWREDIHVLNPASWQDKFAHQWFCSFDYGFAHFTFILLIAVTGEGNLVVVDEHYARKAVPAWHVQEWRKHLVNRGITTFSQLQFFVAGEDIFRSDSDGATIQKQYADLGMVMTAAETDRIAGWASIMQRLGDSERGQKPSLFIHPRCRKLIEQIPTAQHDPHKPEDVLKTDLSDAGEGGDDALDTLRMACHSYRGNVAVSSVMPLGIGWQGSGAKVNI